tara:strand:- start:89 stop:334 length:246 start_codon:yes stop_codon:yes gene_type:complete
MSTLQLLEDSLKDPLIANTKSFYWYATPIGIAALSKEKESSISEHLYKNLMQQGLEVGLDLSREERELYHSYKGLIILFYS